MEILTYTETVESLLKEYPRLRNSDKKLIANIWFKTLASKKINSNKLSAYDFLKMFAKGDLPNPESIRRIRQKLQQEFPELRGTNSILKQNESEKVKNDLRNTPSILAGGRP